MRLGHYRRKEKFQGICIPPLLLLLLALPYQASAGADDTAFPGWIQELRSLTVRTLQTEVEVAQVRLPDNIEEGKQFTCCLKGEGKLGKTPDDTFALLERMFSTGGWRYSARYQADGHGSTAFAYEQGKRLCHVFMHMDASCDDEETGHVANIFWFEIYCAEEMERRLNRIKELKP